MSLQTLSSRFLFKLFDHGVTSSCKPFRGRLEAATVLGRSSIRGHFNTKKPRYPDSSQVRVVDLRSDAVTKPGPAMRKAMGEAVVGDDALAEDPTVNELQELAADMFGMEEALFVSTGTMSNLIAVMVHCRERGDEMIVGDLSHLQIYEQGGSAHLAGVHAATVTTLPDGTFDLDQLESKIYHGYPNPRNPRSRLICLENTHNIQGGRVLPLTFLQEVRALADRYGLSVHMDGARVMNAAVAQGVSPSTILQHTDTVSVCLSKGLGAPVGTMLAGPKDFISRARHCRQALGGGLLQVGVLAAAGKLSLLEMIGRLEEDHRNAKTFAQALLDCDPPIFDIDMAAVETNILCFRLREHTLSPSEFCARMGQVGEREEAALGQGVVVLIDPYYGNLVRAVWHLDISSEDTQLAIQKMQFVASQFLEEKLRTQ
ncbi:probable low-specificity L-threonine aldolase 2 [Cheilinus undulatus]|uniref:probable low-specificity L-threonine aldolase 2 n=1 Tax=Cheilinus undulatus TaxID=241271 RepID=UPI001BD5D49C|nr:probable low-specificity L-threonine aldolase 2 [Cheilinus undulatus]